MYKNIINNLHSLKVTQLKKLNFPEKRKTIFQFKKIIDLIKKYILNIIKCHFCFTIY